MDFYRISLRDPKRKGEPEELYPDFKVGRSKDLMVKGRAFYAIWDEEAGLWSTDEYDVQRLVDADLDQYAKRLSEKTGLTYSVKHLSSFGTGGWSQFRKYMQNVSDNAHQLDAKLTFANTPVKKTDYVSRRLPYALEPGDFSAWDELVGTLYSVEERAKIEWIIGAIVSGDSTKIQKFGVFYGPPGSGKGTILDVVLRMFEGYTTTFNAKALGSSNATFATEVFRNHPLVAVQHDGDLSKIEDNARLNSIISHEPMEMQEKFKPTYTSYILAFLLLGTNKPVKITDAKSGIIRRLIDIHPTGVRIPENHYNTLMAKTDFELGAIAYHCLEVYRQMGRNYYSSYRPLEMMLQTDVFFNFIEAHYDVFREQDGASLRQAYAMYTEWCKDTGVEFVLPQYKFRTEFANYFDEFKDRATIDGQLVRSYYSGFNANKFKTPIRGENAYSLVLEESESLLDELFADLPAQLANEEGFPKRRWVNVQSTLQDIDTSQLHYVKVPLQHIVIDFDLKDETGEKSLERNLEAASVWPATYAELSKGGNGVHLHYLYEGDVTELAPVYSDGIEVKTLLGDSSLRRRVSRCNNIPVASIAGGLPIKEKKPVIQEKQIKSERGLRDLITRALGKEFGHTKSSVDFIKKILDDAYESGLTYDVTDLRGTILAFANNSSNQSLLALKTVQAMKFKGQDIPDEELKSPESEVLDTDEAEDQEAKREYDRLVFFDVEVYPNLFVICWKFRDAPDTVRMVNPKPSDIEPLLRMMLVGFNCRRYDNHILWAAYMGYNNLSLYNLSQAIIGGNRNAMFGEAYNLSYADIYEFSSIKQSLKMFMIDLGVNKVEMEIPWDQPVPDDMRDKVIEYCVNDVEGTEVVFQDRFQDYVARQILAELSGLSMNDTTQRHTAKILFGNNREANREFEYTHLSTVFPGYKFELGKSSFMGEDPSEGGYVYEEKGVYEDVAVFDVTSMHPTSIINLNYFGPYTDKFKDLVDTRVAIKNGDFEAARTMLDGRLKPYLTDEGSAEQLSYALKIVINIVYGMTSAKFENPFKNHENIDNIVAKRGALFMIALKHHMQGLGYKVVHIKTDSIKLAGVPRGSDIEEKAWAEVHRFGREYGYNFEHEATYDRFCLIDKAQYIAHYGWAAKAKKIGTWEAVGAKFQHPYVFKSLFSHEEIGLNDMTETKNVMKGAMYLDFELDNPQPVIENMKFIGRVGRFVPVREGQNGGALYRTSEDTKTGEVKVHAVQGTKGYLWIEADRAKARHEQHDLVIDTDYFEALASDAVKTINQFGDFESFVR